MDKPSLKNVVLVHGGFVDGAGWEGVHRILKKKGYDISIVQNPTTSLKDDVVEYIIRHKKLWYTTNTC